MTFTMKMSINHLALLFTKIRGYEATEGLDFSESEHPIGKCSWNQAVVAWSVLKEDESVLKYQRKN